MPESEGAIAIAAREYKMMLDAGLFPREEAARAAAVAACWAALRGALSAAGLQTEGTLARGGAGKQRLVRFLDTTDAAFRRGGFIFRMRRRQDGEGRWKATLKHRSADWVRAATARFAPDGQGGEAKLEEDVKGVPAGNGLQYVPLFSRSAEARGDGETMPRTVGECLKPFRISKAEEFPDAGTEVGLVGFEARESVWSGVELALPGNARAGLVLILWDRSDEERAAAAELSFRYDLGEGAPKAAPALGAWSAFLAFDRTAGWVYRAGPTKTALVYGDV